MITNRPRTLTDIASMADVTVEEVTKVFFGKQDIPLEVRDRILKVMAKLNSVEMSTRLYTEPQPKTSIGIIIDDGMVEDYVGKVVEGISKEINTAGFQMFINIMRHDDTDFSKVRGDAIIAVIPRNYALLTAYCQAHHIPYVLMDYEPEIDPMEHPVVYADNNTGIARIMDYLFKNGHTRIGFITGIMSMITALDRYNGYCDSLKNAGIPIDPELIENGEFTHASGYRCAMKMLQLPDRPTAIVCSNDLMAFGVYQAAQELGLKVGRDVSVTGVDDIPLAASVVPPLTTLRQPMQELGVAAFELLIDLINGTNTVPRFCRFETELLVRASTGPAPRHI